MEIVNTAYRIARDGAPWLATLSRGLASVLGPNVYPLRLSIVGVRDRDFTVEATIVRFDPRDRHARFFRNVEVLDPQTRGIQARPFVAVQIIPTGVRCEFGGFAGDGCPVTNLLASSVDYLVTHPNAVNASDLNEMARNILYVEGKSLDNFLLGHVGLVEVNANKIGTFIDPVGIDHIMK